MTASNVDLVIPNSVTTIPSSAFGYSSFKSIKYPENETYKSASFPSGLEIEKAYIPTSVTSLDGNLEAISNITLYMYGPERTLSKVSLSSFKQVVWNYTD